MDGGNQYVLKHYLYIIRPIEKARLYQLRRKLDEYKKRFENEDDIDPQLRAKIYILETLLSVGFISLGNAFAVILREFSAEFETEFLVEATEDAFDVIEDYCLTGGLELENGDLPSPLHPVK